MPPPKVLPHRPDAEQAVLGGVMLRGRRALLEVLDLLKPEDFYVPRNQAIFRAMIALDRCGEPIDVITLESQLRLSEEIELVGGIEGLARLDRYATAHNIKAHAELVLDAAIIRNTVVEAREIAERGLAEVEDGREFLARSRARLAVIGSGERRPYRSAAEIMRTAMPAVVERKATGSKTTVTGVPTYLVDLDQMTNGLQPTDLIILAARPSMGKTAFALQLACAASVCQDKHWLNAPDDRPQTYPVLCFSLEMSAGQLIERALAREARVKLGDIKSTAPFYEQDMKRFIRAAERIAQAPLAIDDSPALRLDQIRSRTLRWLDDPYYFPSSADEIGKKKGAVLVDYLQLARGNSDHYGSREQEISEISRGLKGLAKEIGMPVIALSQLNRAVDSRADHRPQLSDLRESGAIEQDADVIMFIYREERYLAPDAPPDKVEAADGKAEIIIGKQRNGPIGTVHLRFNKDEQRFESVVREGTYDGL